MLAFGKRNYFMHLLTTAATERQAGISFEETAHLVGELVSGQRDRLEFEYPEMNDGTARWMTVEARAVAGAPDVFYAVIRDDTELRRHAADALHGQKFEAVGQLAAGVAHEINTPIQFIGDNTRFLGDSVQELATLLDLYREHRATRVARCSLARSHGGERDGPPGPRIRQPPCNLNCLPELRACRVAGTAALMARSCNLERPEIVTWSRPKL